MAQEKPTSLRILQAPKKKSASPLLFGLVGFVTGVGVTLIAFFIIFQPSINVAVSEQQIPHVLEASTNPVQHAPSGTHSATETSHPHSVSLSNETDESEATIQQPKDSELSKLFSHTPTGIAAQRNSSSGSQKPQPKSAINKTPPSVDSPNTAKNFADPFPTQHPHSAPKKTEESQTTPATVNTSKSTEVQ